jgi:hypothetical protein
MAGEPPNDTVWWSPLEECPEHVRAIGMISIENANLFLEYELADLFFRILQIRPHVGRAIYLTPKSAIARIEIFENASKAVLAPKTENENFAAAFLEKALCIAPRARAVVGSVTRLFTMAGELIARPGTYCVFQQNGLKRLSRLPNCKTWSVTFACCLRATD